MSNPATRRTKAPAKTAAASPIPPSPAEKASEREPRGARRKRETRGKLMEAAFRLMAERGVDAVAINEITEAADVGFGSFYNHFESKEAIYAVVVAAVFEDFGDALDYLVKDVEDPAEVIAISIRHTLLRARREPLWGRFLIREGLSARVLSHGLGLRLMRDIQKGSAKGRFQLPDPLLSFVTAGAGILGAISAEVQLESEQAAVLEQLGFNTENISERTAAVVLANLGLPYEEALRISRRPLPVVDAPA